MLSLGFFILTQVCLYYMSTPICLAAQRYLDGYFFANACLLLTTMMLYKYWDSITNEDTELALKEDGAKPWSSASLADTHDALDTIGFALPGGKPESWQHSSQPGHDPEHFVDQYAVHRPPMSMPDSRAYLPSYPHHQRPLPHPLQPDPSLPMQTLRQQYGADALQPLQTQNGPHREMRLPRDLPQEGYGIHFPAADSNGATLSVDNPYGMQTRTIPPRRA